MKKVLNVLFIICFIFNSTATFADDLTPADVYYRDNIAVNEISAKSPRIDDEDEPDPEGGPPTGGMGDGEFVGGPLEDAILPIVIAGIAYSVFALTKRRTRKTL